MKARWNNAACYQRQVRVMTRQENTPSAWDRVQGKIQEVAGRAIGDEHMTREGEVRQHGVDVQPDVGARGVDPLSVDGEMGQGGGRQFDPDPLRSNGDEPSGSDTVAYASSGANDPEQRNQGGETAEFIDHDPGRPDSQEDRDVQHRSRRTQAEPGWISPEDGTAPDYDI